MTDGRRGVALTLVNDSNAGADEASRDPVDASCKCLIAVTGS